MHARHSARRPPLARHPRPHQTHPPLHPRPPVTLNISDITPLPVNVSYYDEPLAANLFRPLIKLWGSKVCGAPARPWPRPPQLAAGACPPPTSPRAVRKPPTHPLTHHTPPPPGV